MHAKGIALLSSLNPAPPVLTHTRRLPAVQAVTDFFNRKVEEGLKAQGAGGETSAELVLSIIKQHSRGWRRDKLRPFTELRFTYEEGGRGGKW